MLPLFGEGETKFQPIYVSDLCKAIVTILDKEEIDQNIYELGGSQVYTFKEMMEILLKQIKKTIDKGHKICLWPKTIKYKDINDMVIAGYNKEEIKEIINDNTFSGATAQLKFTEWRRINA